MEKILDQKAKQHNDHHDRCKGPLIWDCESSLYDSFELKSFERQLSSAITATSRTPSMPHFSDHKVARVLNQPPQQAAQPPSKKKLPGKFSRSINKFLGGVFKPKKKKNDLLFEKQDYDHQDHGFFLVFDKSCPLSTIEEGHGFDNVSPEIRSLVKRSSSERFTSNSAGNSRLKPLIVVNTESSK